MSKFDPIAVFMNILRTVSAFIFIIVIILLFFSLKITILNDDLKRFNMELSDALSGTGLASDKAVFNAKELSRVELTTKETELYARDCGYGYTVEIESLTNNYCKNDESCRGFCDSACGIGSECNCNNVICLPGLYCSGLQDFCECKKGEEWISKHTWKFGKEPQSTRNFGSNFAETEGGLFESVTSEFPAAIDAYGNTIPAKLKLTTYDSFLTRLTCAAQKAYETKTSVEMSFDVSKLPVAEPTSSPSLIFFRKDDQYVCIYQTVDGQDKEVQCRYLPNVPIKELRREYLQFEKLKRIIVYPLSNENADCAGVSDSDIATTDVTTVMLCPE